MATITTREEFKAYCLRRLGAPVIEINIDDEQVEDRIDDAIQYWQDYHFDGLQKFYYIKAITQTDIDRKFILVNDVRDSSNNALEIIGITRVFPITDSQVTVNMFDLRYQLRLHELYDFTSASYVNYTMTQQHIRSLELMFSGEVPIRFTRHIKRLYIDWGWSYPNTTNTIIVAECYGSIDPTVYFRVWNDRWLKEYTTALIKRTWGNNLKKFSGLMLPGGVTMNGDKIYQEAVDEINKLESQMQTEYGAPLEFLMN